MKKNISNDENPYSLSIGDLMAALMLVFALLLCVALKRNNALMSDVKQIESEYVSGQDTLRQVLSDKLRSDIVRWGAELIDTTLTIRFAEEIIFGQNEVQLKEKSKALLSDFFPKYIDSLFKYRNHIAEIRIEGHTSSEAKGLDENDKYFINMRISQERSRNVLEFCVGNTGLPDSLMKWVRSCATANGLSSSHLLYKDKLRQVEDTTKSRRVEFRILTKSEEALGKISTALSESKELRR